MPGGARIMGATEATAMLTVQAGSATCGLFRSGFGANAVFSHTGWTAVHVKLGNIFAGETMRARKPDHQSLIQEIA